MVSYQVGVDSKSDQITFPVLRKSYLVINCANASECLTEVILGKVGIPTNIIKISSSIYRKSYLVIMLAN